MIREAKTFSPFYQTNLGEMVQGDCLDILKGRKENTVDLIITSPPFGLIRKKEYGNVHAEAYCDWFKAFGEQFHRVLKDSGSLVIDIGGAWKDRLPVRSLYHFKLMIMLCEEVGFHLAQEFYWWNPCRMPNPAEWVSIRRIRVKDAVNTIWWLSKTPWPKASNWRVLQPYTPNTIQWLSMKQKKAANQPCTHQSGKNFNRDNGAAIPHNLIALPNAWTNNAYTQYCRKKGLPLHPARFPSELPEFFVRMLTDPGDIVIDPFAGSCTTGEVCERLTRHWQCIDLSKGYLEGAIGRFENSTISKKVIPKRTYVDPTKEFRSYRLPRPGAFWGRRQDSSLPVDGGKNYRLNLSANQRDHFSTTKEEDGGKL